MGRWRRAVRRRRTVCLWLLLLASALSTLVLPELLSGGGGRNPASARRSSRYRMPSAPDLEVMADSRDPALELDADLPPLQSLQEDQLLFVSGTKNPPQRKAYRVLLPGTNKENRGVARAAQGDTGEDAQPSSAQKYGFNEAVGEGISAHRGLPEARHPRCLERRYSESLPSASVVICFHDEARSTLLRTVHSVLSTAPERHLREVLLVDDLSQHGHLKSALSEYLSHLSRVRLVRSARRLGLGGCRSLGASKAEGELLVFVDSHCECQKGWLEPLLERVAQDRTRVVSPIIDLIDGRTFRYSATRWPVRGVFDWRLDFHWESPTSLAEKEPASAVGALPSPALGGEAFAIDRRYFHRVGGFDPGMLLWGEEHLELSIRVWSCGGSVEVVPCSRVAHLDRPGPPRSLPDQDLLQSNKIRLAEAWMGADRKIFYRRDTLAHFIRQSESPDVTERLRLHQSLGCKDFRWYLSTVYPQLYVPEDRPALSGELYNVGTASCADCPRRRSRQGGVLMAPCGGTGSQHCELNSKSEIRCGPEGGLCFGALGERVGTSPCAGRRPSTGGSQWDFVKPSGQLLHLRSQLCLEAVPGAGLAHSSPKDARSRSGGRLLLRPCTRHPRQQWQFDQLVE